MELPDGARHLHQVPGQPHRAVRRRRRSRTARPTGRSSSSPSSAGPPTGSDEADAWSHIAGLTVGQDISDRILQFAAGSQFSLGKSHRGFGPLGPWVVTIDEFDDPDDLALGCSVDGETMQDARTSDLVFSVPRLVAELSAVLPLLPGDIIFTGTPSGIGATRTAGPVPAAGRAARDVGRGHRHDPQPVRLMGTYANAFGPHAPDDHLRVARVRRAAVRHRRSRDQPCRRRRCRLARAAVDPRPDRVVVGLRGRDPAARRALPRARRRPARAGALDADTRPVHARQHGQRPRPLHRRGDRPADDRRRAVVRRRPRARGCRPTPGLGRSSARTTRIRPCSPPRSGPSSARASVRASGRSSPTWRSISATSGASVTGRPWSRRSRPSCRRTCSSSPACSAWATHLRRP